MNLIFGAFAVLEGYREGEQPNRGTDSYYRCIVFSLASAKPGLHRGTGDQRPGTRPL